MLFQHVLEDKNFSGELDFLGVFRGRYFCVGLDMLNPRYIYFAFILNQTSKNPLKLMIS